MWGIVGSRADARIHVIPLDDLKPHEYIAACWCAPSEDADESVLVHHSLDGREGFESGERLMS